MQTIKNSRLLGTLLSIQLFLVAIPYAAGADPPVPEQVKQWMAQCEKKNAQGEYAEARLLCQHAVDTMESVLPAHPFFASALNTLGEIYHAQGNYARAESLFQRSLHIREKVLSPKHLDIAESLSNLATAQTSLGHYSQVEQLFQRSLQILEKVLGSDHLNVAAILNNFAMFYKEKGDYAHAESLVLRSIHIKEKKLGSENLDVALSINNLAEIYQIQGKYDRAEPLYLRSLQIEENLLGPEDLQLASTINNLASLQTKQGNYAQAELLYLRSIHIKEKALGQEHPDLALTLNNLGTLYYRQGSDDQAMPLLLRSLRIRENLLGPDHPNIALAINNIAQIYKVKGNYIQAEKLFLRSLNIDQKIYGHNHRNVAIDLNNLAGLYLSQKNYVPIEPLLFRALQIWEDALGPEHPEVADCLNNLAHYYLTRGQSELALPMLERALSIRERSLRTVATEARVSAFLDNLRPEEDMCYSLLLLQKNPSQRVRMFAMHMSLLRKGRAAEAGLMTGFAVQASLTSDSQRARFANWQTLRSQYEALFFRGPLKPYAAGHQAHQARLGELKNRLDSKEHELARFAPQLQQWKLPAPEAILAKVAARLSTGSALVEVLLVKPGLFQDPGKGETRRGPPRYLALILFPNKNIDFVDLGNAEEIDQSTSELLAAMRNIRQEPRHQAQALYQKIMVPLLATLGSTKMIYVSLDGSLNLVPFAALHDGKHYLLDAPYQIQYLSSGRELLRDTLGKPAQPAIVMADPDFGGQTTGLGRAEARKVDAKTSRPYDGLGILPQLQGARAEGVFVGGLLRVLPLLGAAATEARLRQARSPWLLHIATHGLFLDTAFSRNQTPYAKEGQGKPSDSNQPSGGSEESAQGRSALLLIATPATAGIPNPSTIGGITRQTEAQALFQSALALAGASHAADAPDAANDGLLTAEEVRSLALFGTQLVVLSACDTGLGTVKPGQGVYGLRRAFLAAGAQTVVMSLWPVSDIGTQSLMQRYYRLLLDPKQPRGRVSGLLEAMKAVKTERPHPYYWAPFIANGLDAPLQPAPRGTGSP